MINCFTISGLNFWLRRYGWVVVALENEKGQTPTAMVPVVPAPLGE
jgi:hypothetical protein